MNKEQFSKHFINKFEGRKSYVFELLATQFGSDHQYVYEWNTYVSTHYSKRKPILNQLTKNVKKAHRTVFSDNGAKIIKIYLSDVRY